MKSPLLAGFGFSLAIAAMICPDAAIAAVEVCSPPACPAPKVLSVSGPDELLGGFLMVCAFASAWLLVNGAFWYAGFFPARPMPAQIRINPELRAFWEEQAEAAAAEARKWKSDPALAELRKTWGLRFLFAAAAIFFAGLHVQQTHTPDPSNVRFSYTAFDGSADSELFFGPEGSIFENGKAVGKWSAMSDRVLARSAETGRTSCWFWTDDRSELWSFGERCPGPSELPQMAPAAKIVPVYRRSPVPGYASS